MNIWSSFPFSQLKIKKVYFISWKKIFLSSSCVTVVLHQLKSNYGNKSRRRKIEMKHVWSSRRGGDGFSCCMVSRFSLDLRRIKWWSGLFLFLFFPTPSLVEVMPRIDTLLTRLLEILRKLFLDLFRLFFLNLLFAFSFSLLHIADIQLLSLSLHVSEKLHYHHVGGVFVFFRIIFRYFFISSAILLELFALFSNEQICSFFRLLINIQALLSCHIVLEYLPGSIYNFKCHLRSVFIILILIWMDENGQSFVFLFYLFDWRVIVKLKDFEWVEIEVSWPSSKKSVNLMLARQYRVLLFNIFKLKIEK